MSKNLESFLSYTWGRRDVEQLVTTSVAVQGLFYALQLVVLQAVPTIQEGPVLDDIVYSGSKEEDSPRRQVFHLKSGNAKEVDSKCEAHVDPIILSDVEWDNKVEDLSWSDEEEDPRVKNMVWLAEEGFKFSNSMLQGGCIPYEVEVVEKKPRKGLTVKATRGRKVPNHGRIPTVSTSVPGSSNTSTSSTPGSVDIETLTLLLNAKLAGHEARIIDGMILCSAGEGAFLADVGGGAAIHVGRRSKRARTFSTKLDYCYHYDKKTKFLVGHPSPTLSSSSGTISLGDEFTISSEHVLEIIERKKPIGNKFANSAKFIFPQPLVDAIVGSSDVECVQPFVDAEYLGIPFNSDKKHWVAFCVDLNAQKIVVLDPNFNIQSDAQAKTAIQPVALMLPFLFKQVAANTDTTRSIPARNEVESPLGISQVRSQFDDGLMMVFFIHAHASRGMLEVRKLVSTLIIYGIE
ncbi:hypothetical protein CARUB_v10021521mg [Capsella rubella]|uniref:Ubiquitin-like protease family profile domain-containing protein n=1 Tax=Capsella rubella TaxID=81985 RepID=R0I7J5_9BRAS|nr:hypothetical protein CARUB_v10021521mg [Capsella rubella]